MSGGSDRARERDLSVFGEGESPTRPSGEVLRAYARESEALLARGRDPDDAQGLVETMRCGPLAVPPPPALVLPHDAIVRLAVTLEELDWFPLGAESTALARAIDGPSTVASVLSRAGLTEDAGLAPLALMIEMGLLSLG